MATDARAALAGLSGRDFDWGALADARGRVDERTARRSSVLILFGPAGHQPATDTLFDADAAADAAPVAAADTDVLLLRRAATLRQHPGQIAFPGGGWEPGDADATATALREAVEETGLDPSGVEPLAPLPALPLAVSDNLVTPVPAWWRHPSPVRAVDQAETAAVFRARVRDLLNPANRVNVTSIRGMRLPPMPAFQLGDRLVWGFTAIILSTMFDTLGWAQPWDRTRTVEPTV